MFPLVRRRVEVANYTTSATTLVFNFTSFDGAGSNLMYSWNLGLTKNGAEVIPQMVTTTDTLTLRCAIGPLPCDAQGTLAARSDRPSLSGLSKSTAGLH